MQVRLAAKKRDEKGKGAARRARREGLVPAVVYGKGMAPLPLSVARKDVHKALHTEAGRNVLVELEIDDRKKPILAIPREIQRDPIKDEYLHIDFMAVRKDTRIHTEVPVVIEGKAPALQKGFVIESHLTSVQVECLPTSVPAQLTVSAELLSEGGDVIKAGDIPLPEGVQLLTEPDEIIASLSLPPAGVAAGGVEGGEAAEAGEQEAS
jgi:large subunit ribosomal protein L25